MNRDPQAVPGVEADRPSEIPPPGWFQIVKRAWKESKKDSVPLLSAGVAFYAFLALVPALIAVVMIYGLVSDADEVAEQVESFGSALPSSAEELLSDQMTTLANTSDRSLSVGLVLALGLALWSASSGISNLITAVNVAYDEEEKRGFVKSRALALGMTVGAIVFVVIAVALVAAIPVVLDALNVPGWVEAVAQVGRWLGLVVVVLIALALLYRWAPDRDSPKFRWLSIGAIVATVLWVVASIGFSIYVDNFASYGKTYGSLAGVIVLLLWLWLGAYATLLGAEINAEMEQQTVKDTTKGEPRPLGQRRAVKADSIPGDEGTVADGPHPHPADQDRSFS
ncbi:MAG TPA: YihY/virulence factor BrkB family protein [Jiangellaceae bacterium]|nr:YihY/virulence factor BrkB family protein [Jiangellaceae bacterium]